MDMAYTPSGRIIWKHRNAQSSSVSETADIYYGYCDDYQPHAVKRMFDHNNGMLYDLRWDEAGNLGQVSIAKPGEMFEAGRFLFWTEDSRMHTAVDDKHYSYYAYDYGGERRLKLVGVNSSVDVNAEYMNASSALNEPTLYPSAYMVLTNKGYTKHYYAGTERVAARLGGGGLDALYHVIENDGELQTKADSLFDQCLEQVNSRVLNENDLECIMRNRFAKEEFGYWIDDIPYQMKADVKFDHDQFKDMVDSMLTDYHNGKEKEVYFYHSDHLGSASWITDSIGIPIQHLQYLPYGEPYIDQRAAGTTYSERFRFTGKERDEETGYGYFGARYMDHELMTMWLSVDPMADKYPSINPYAYCAWNPIKLVDPDGREINPVFGTDGVYKGCTTEGYTGTIIIYDGNDDFSALTAEELIETTNNCKKAASYYSREVSKKMTAQAKKEMYTHIIGIADGTPIGESVFCSEDMTLIYNSNGNGNWNTRMVDVGKDYFILTATDKYIFGQGIEDGAPCFQGSYEATVENILSTVVNHEWYGHFINKYTGADHYKCYEASKESPYYSKTTERYKEFIEQRIVHFKNK